MALFSSSSRQKVSQQVVPRSLKGEDEGTKVILPILVENGSPANVFGDLCMRSEVFALHQKKRCSHHSATETIS